MCAPPIFEIFLRPCENLIIDQVNPKQITIVKVELKAEEVRGHSKTTWTNRGGGVMTCSRFFICFINKIVDKRGGRVEKVQILSQIWHFKIFLDAEIYQISLALL